MAVYARKQYTHDGSDVTSRRRGHKTPGSVMGRGSGIVLCLISRSHRVGHHVHRLDPTSQFVQGLHQETIRRHCRQTCQVSLFGSVTHTFPPNHTLTHQRCSFHTLFPAWCVIYAILPFSSAILQGIHFLSYLLCHVG